MSDRLCVIEIPTRAIGCDGQVASRVQLFMNGETGTWRLMVGLSSVDFSLSGLRHFHVELAVALKDIADDPDKFDAEVRARRLMISTLKGEQLK